MTQSRKSDSIQGLEQFCAKLKGRPLSAVERANLRELLRQAVYDTVAAMKRLVEENPEAHR